MKSSNSPPQKVYRYIPVHRLWQVLATECLYFMRNSKWDDPFEGYLVKQYCKTIGEHYEKVNSDKFFLCCSLKREKDHLWRNYTPNKDGVVVTLNVEALQKATSSIICRPIIYGPRGKIGNVVKEMRKLKKGGKPLSQDAILRLFFVKRLAFENEEEIRFLIQDATCEDDIVSVKIQTKKVIESIMFDPRMDHDAYMYHKEFIRDRFRISSGISHSSLYDPDRAFKH